MFLNFFRKKTIIRGKKSLAQNITIRIMDERGNYLEICDVNGNFLNILLFEIRDYKKHYPLLSYINPWGNTYYNELQVKDLIIELEILKSEKFMKKYLSDIDKLILFAKNVTTHRYLKFIGD